MMLVLRNYLPAEYQLHVPVQGTTVVRTFTQMRMMMKWYPKGPVFINYNYLNKIKQFHIK